MFGRDQAYKDGKFVSMSNWSSKTMSSQFFMHLWHFFTIMNPLQNFLPAYMALVADDSQKFRNEKLLLGL